MTEGVYIGEVNQSRKKHKRLWWLAFVSGGAFTILFGGALLILHTSLFKVDKVEIYGNSQISEENILALLAAEVTSDSWVDRVLGKSNMLSWPNSFVGQDLRFAPVLKNISIQKNYSENLVLVSVAERLPRGIWCLEKAEPANCYWFDEDGILFKPAFSSEGNLIRVVRDYAHVSLGMGHPVLSRNLPPNLFSVLRVLEESNLSVKEVGLYDLSLEEIETSTFNGPRVLFSLRFPPQGAAEVIQSLRSKKNFNSLNYIDFRVEHRAYYK